MFDASSRYARLPVLTYLPPGQPPVAYVARRFLPSGALPVLGETAARSDDRPDLIAVRTLGDAMSFWRVADANPVMDPGELVEVTGRVLRIPVPQPEGVR
jgi:hypothetical protein